MWEKSDLPQTSASGTFPPFAKFRIGVPSFIFSVWNEKTYFLEQISLFWMCAPGAIRTPAPLVRMGSLYLAVFIYKKRLAMLANFTFQLHQISLASCQMRARYKLALLFISTVSRPKFIA